MSDYLGKDTNVEAEDTIGDTMIDDQAVDLAAILGMYWMRRTGNIVITPVGGWPKK